MISTIPFDLEGPEIPEWAGRRRAFPNGRLVHPAAF